MNTETPESEAKAYVVQGLAPIRERWIQFQLAADVAKCATLHEELVGLTVEGSSHKVVKQAIEVLYELRRAEARLEARRTQLCEDFDSEVRHQLAQ